MAGERDEAKRRLHCLERDALGLGEALGAEGPAAGTARLTAFPPGIILPPRKAACSLVISRRASRRSRLAGSYGPCPQPWAHLSLCSPAWP